MNRLFIYEEYGAKYEMMMKDVAAARRTMPGWESYQKGLEAFAGVVGSVGQQLDSSRKSLTIGDLLVKVNLPHRRGHVSRARSLNKDSRSKESANTHCCSLSYSSMLQFATARARMRSSRAF